MPESRQTNLVITAVFLLFGIIIILLAIFMVNLDNRLAQVTKNQIVDTLKPQLVPTGTIIPYASAKDWEELTKNREPLEGYLPCDGRILDGNESQYKQLYEIIGDTWGALSLAEKEKYFADIIGDTWGALSPEEKEEHFAKKKLFRLPDLRNQFLRGAGTQPVGTTEGYTTALPQGKTAFTINEAGDHTHTIAKSGGHTHGDPQPPPSQDGKGTPGKVRGSKGMLQISQIGQSVTPRGFDPDQKDNRPGYEELDIYNLFQITGGDHQHTITNSGGHSHTLIDGDDETRPQNKRVAFFIKL